MTSILCLLSLLKTVGIFSTPCFRDNSSRSFRDSGQLIFKWKWMLPYEEGIQFSSVQSLSSIQLFATPWTAAHQVSLSFTVFWSLFKFMSIKSMMPFKYLILYCCLFLLPSLCPGIRIFSSEWVLHIKWSKYWSFSFSISPSSEYLGLTSFKIDWFDLLEIQGTHMLYFLLK